MSKYKSAQDVLDEVWNDSGEEHFSDDSDFEENFDALDHDSMESDVSSSEDEDVQASDGESTSDEGQQSNTGQTLQRRPRQQQPTLVWRMATGIPPSNFPFTANTGVQVPTAGFESYDYFALYIDDDLMNCFVTETNRYAKEFIDSTNLSRSSRANDWYDTDPKEMRQFFGLLFLMGIVRKPRLDMFWSKDPLYSTPIFSAIMSRNRFQLILKFLHFNDNSQMAPANDPSPDKLYKLRPLIDHLFEKFQEVYTPSQNVSIDESLLLWKGRLSFKQYIPLKRARFGIKTFMLCEDSGYTYRFKIYTGKENVVLAQQELSLSERVVADLMQPLLEVGYHLYTDNWYTSIPLYKYLHQHGTLACGTIRSNRKGFPEQVKNAKLKKGEVMACHSDELMALKFKDKKDVHMLSTIHDHSMVHRPDRRHRNQRQTTPACIFDYNKYMGGVDRTDQLMQPYEIPRKSMKWYKKVALHFIQLAVMNSYIVYQKDGGRMPLLAFEHDVIVSLLFGHGNGGDVDIPKEENIARLSERHFVALIPETESKQKPQKRCRVCYKKGVRKESRYQCLGCPSNPGLCYYPCFELYHTKFTYWL